MIGNNVIVLFSIGEHRDFIEYFFYFGCYDSKRGYDWLRCFLCI